MTYSMKPFVHLPIDAVDAVVLDPEGRYDPELFDHYSTFDEARDAALSSVELLLDEGDYDGEDHREELERMRAMLDVATSYEDLERQDAYRWFLARIEPARPVAA